MRNWKTGVVLYGLGCGVLGVYLAGQTWADGEGSPDERELRREIQKLDLNKDGMLQPDEAPVDQTTFERADTDDDGSLSVDEIIVFKRHEDASKKVGKDTKVRQKFAEADKNGDGKVTPDEFPANEMLFTKLDRDGNGEVTYPEALAYSVEEELAKVYAEHDADLSGTLTLEELPKKEKGARAIFRVADADGDGQVTGEEAYAYVYRVRLGDGEPTAANSKPGQKSEGSATGKNPNAKSVLGHLQKNSANADRDGDGKVTLAEFPGSADLFTFLDMDRDGAVDQAEMLVRLEMGKDLAKRGERLRSAVKQLGLEDEIKAFGMEVQGLFVAGRYDIVRDKLDELELRIARYRLEKGQ